MPPGSSANLAAIVGLLSVIFLIVRSSALSLAIRKLFADLCSASLVFSRSLITSSMRLIQRVRQPTALFAHRAQSLCHRQLARHLARVELGFQRLNLGVFGSRSASQRMGDLVLGQGNRVALFPLG